MSTLNHLPSTASADQVASSLREDGYVIVDNLASQEQMDRLSAEIQPYIDATPVGKDSVSGTKTRRTGSLIARSAAARELVMNPLALASAKEVLSHASNFQLHVTQVISIYPGQKAQAIHRDEFAWDGFPFPNDYDVQCNVLWALSEYTDEIGATRVIPGSHRLNGPQHFTPQDTVAAEMERGSALFYTGKIYHGGGENRTPDKVRQAVNLTYAVGWVRQEENQYLSTPRDIALTLDDDLLRIMGYDMGNAILGSIRDVEDPLSALRDNLESRMDYSTVDLTPRAGVNV
ncbi:phytanoyl-CoA dioxygenase family protein [Rhodococcus qingshengii]|uniref:phytanoyl-CoA dioxygenase family protein n=1 Tax=Rhodococcus qingshengii TaxID=334542 RepID=UPI0036D7C26D